MTNQTGSQGMTEMAWIAANWREFVRFLVEDDNARAARVPKLGAVAGT
jgi:hypothetical protein